MHFYVDRDQLCHTSRVAFVFLTALVCLSEVRAEDPPNIVFLFADDLGWGDLSCYGQPRVKTPHLDRLAGQGTLFTQFYVAGSVCSPSRTGIMTGHYPARHRIFGHLAANETNARREMPNALDPDVVTLTDVLKQAGYETAHFGKWHLGNVSPLEVRRLQQMLMKWNSELPASPVEGAAGKATWRWPGS